MEKGLKKTPPRGDDRIAPEGMPTVKVTKEENRGRKILKKRGQGFKVKGYRGRKIERADSKPTM